MYSGMWLRKKMFMRQNRADEMYNDKWVQLCIYQMCICSHDLSEKICLVICFMQEFALDDFIPVE